jgi:hypothetical protein
MDLKLCVPLKHYNCNMTKIVRDFFVQFELLEFLKFKRIYLNTYIFNIIKIPKYFSHILSQMFRWTAKFRIQILYGMRDTKKRSCLWGKKSTSTDLDAPLNSPDRGTAETVLRKSGLIYLLYIFRANCNYTKPNWSSVQYINPGTPRLIVRGFPQFSGLPFYKSDCQTPQGTCKLSKNRSKTRR